MVLGLMDFLHIEALEHKQDPLTGKVIGCAIEVHKALGPGLLESVYEECLDYKLNELGLNVKRQVPLPVF